jgi:copper chaperone
MQNVKLKVKGMSCGLCVKSIEGAFHEIGVKATADLASATVTVEYDENKHTLQNLKEVIEEQGYKAV